MYPKAREDGLRVRDVGGQFAVFDEQAERLHILNETVAIVWRHCDGSRSTGELARILASETSSAVDEETILTALDRLAAAGLLESVPDAAGPTMSRRRLLHGAAGLAVGAAVPTVISLALPGRSARASSAKVQICHKGNTIWVDRHAVPAHLAHGDTLGRCGATTSTTTAKPTTTTEAPTTSPAPHDVYDDYDDYAGADHIAADHIAADHDDCRALVLGRGSAEAIGRERRPDEG